MDLMGGYYGGGFFPAEKRLSDQQRSGGGDHNHNNFMVDDLLDFSNTTDDAMVTDDFLNIEDADITKNSNDHSSTANTTTTDSCNSSSGYGHNSVADSHFSNELCVPYDDMAELEWLSNFVEDSFSTDQNLQTNHLHILTGSKPTTPESSSSETTHLVEEPTTRNPIFQPEPTRPGKARSKRSRVAPCDWSTRLLHLEPTTKPSPKKQEKPNPNNSDSGSEGVVRRCLHCASEKTPQWRTGPMGPKTLCNACGVRYKSGRLVPEYRPAASPTFISAKHSNSHRKVVELRRQKEMMQRGRQEQQFLTQTSIFGVSNDFLFHHQSGPNNFTHLI